MRDTYAIWCIHQSSDMFLRVGPQNISRPETSPRFKMISNAGLAQPIPFIFRRKTEFMESQSLFMLVSERLLLYPDQITIATYNAMYEVMVENPCTQILRKPHQEPSPNTYIVNPGKKSF